MRTAGALLPLHDKRNERSKRATSGHQDGRIPAEPDGHTVCECGFCVGMALGEFFWGYVAFTRL